MRELLLGSGPPGHGRVKRIHAGGLTDWLAMVALDINTENAPDVVHDLNDPRLPFDDDTFAEIHAYHVLEHVGAQGDWRFFFDQWADFWRVLKHGGIVAGMSPHESSPWAWGDPGHTRIFSLDALTFLSQPAYAYQVGVTGMTDYRFHFKADFDILYSEQVGGEVRFVLQAIKPSRIGKPYTMESYAEELAAKARAA